MKRHLLILAFILLISSLVTGLCLKNWEVRDSAPIASEQVQKIVGEQLSVANLSLGMSRNQAIEQLGVAVKQTTLAPTRSELEWSEELSAVLDTRSDKLIQIVGNSLFKSGVKVLSRGDNSDFVVSKARLNHWGFQLQTYTALDQHPSFSGTPPSLSELGHHDIFLIPAGSKVRCSFSHDKLLYLVLTDPTEIR